MEDDLKILNFKNFDLASKQKLTKRKRPKKVKFGRRPQKFSKLEDDPRNFLNLKTKSKFEKFGTKSQKFFKFVTNLKNSNLEDDLKLF